MKQITNAATRPGVDSGSAIFRNACQREQPSIIALSSISFGNDAKKSRVIHTASGRLKPA